MKDVNVELTAKQNILMEAKADTIVFGGARGGGKTFGVSACKMVLDVCEWVSEADAKKRDLDVSDYRNTAGDPNHKELYYFKYTIDYPEFRGCIVRKSLKMLVSNTVPECKKVYPLLGGKYLAGDRKWVFPTGAEVELRPAAKPEDIDFFQGQNYQRLVIEELTQMEADDVDKIEASCRSTIPEIPAMKIYTTNPGNRGHKWVKEKFIDVCPALNDGEPVYLEEYDITYQPLKPNKVHTTKTGEKFLFIPSLLFDNPYLAENDKNYVRNMLSKSNHILRRMWLFGDWSVFTGQFFTMWDENIHTQDEMEFFGAKNVRELAGKRKTFDWGDYRLYMSNDYGFAEKSAWACGMYAVHNETDEMVKFTEIVMSGLTIKEQARMTKEVLSDEYNLSIERFELIVADPNSYWQRKDKGEEFWTFALAYEEEGIILTKGLNDREQGAMAVIQALNIDKDTKRPRLTFLDNCNESIDSIPALPTDSRNPNDVDTTCFDHPYDELRYLLMVLIGDAPDTGGDETRRSWMIKKMQERRNNTAGSSENNWKAA